MVALSKVMAQKRDDFPTAIPAIWNANSFSTRTGFPAHFHNGMLSAWPCTSFVSVVTTTMSHLYNCHVLSRKCYFFVLIFHFWFWKSFCSLIHNNFQSLGSRVWSIGVHLGLRIPQSFFSVQCSILNTHVNCYLFKKELFWWVLE